MPVGNIPDKDLIGYALTHILVSVAKHEDAPASSATHLDMAIDALYHRAVRDGWSTQDPELLDIVNSAVEHMDYYRIEKKLAVHPNGDGIH